jgi:hypothetical protein
MVEAAVVAKRPTAARWALDDNVNAFGTPYGMKAEAKRGTPGYRTRFHARKLSGGSSPGSM